ncbi:MAG: hypothetical protein ACE14P_06270 [Methanotrichaceae archaeon]
MRELKKYQEDIIPGLICKQKLGKTGPYIIFLEGKFIKWWIKPGWGEFKLFHRSKYGPKNRKHSQKEHGKPHELIDYIAKHEAYEKGLIPPFEPRNRGCGHYAKLLNDYYQSLKIESNEV